MKTAAATLSAMSFTFVIRYGLALMLIGIGLLKFTKLEAEAIRPLAENSPFFSWVFPILNTREFSSITGGIEIAMGVLIALRPVLPTLSAVGSFGAAVTFLIILTFVVSSPAHIHKGLTIPFIPHSTLQFIVTHLLLLWASVWTAYEAIVVDRVG